jgi:hypothetical protein
MPLPMALFPTARRRNYKDFAPTTELVLCYEIRGQRWSRENPIEYRVWLTGEVSLSDPPPKKSIPEGLNPVFNGILDHYGLTTPNGKNRTLRPCCRRLERKQRCKT